MRIKDYTTQEENATVSGILLHLRKQEERKQQARWLLGIGSIILVILLFLIVSH